MTKGLSYLIIGGIITLILGVVIGGLIFHPNNSNSPKIIQIIGKSPFGFACWNKTEIKEVSFTVIKLKYTGMSVTDCLDYLRGNYESPADWNNFNYQCVLDRVNSNLENLTKAQSPTWWNNFTLSGDCRCEYSLK